MRHRIRTYYNGKYDDYTIEGDYLEDERRGLLEEPGVTFAEVDGITIKQPTGNMSVYELSRGRLMAVKREYYIHEHEAEGTSWGELADIDDLVSDAKIFEVFAGFTFVPDDFTD